MADLTTTVVLEHCARCDGAGMVLDINAQLAFCAECKGTGRRERTPYEPGRGEQGRDGSYLTTTRETPEEEFELGRVKHNG